MTTVSSLEHDAEMRRRRLSHSLDELTDRLTPGSVVDEIMRYARAGGVDFLKGLGKSAAANPIPTLLVGIGCAMFLTGRTGLTSFRPSSQMYSGPGVSSAGVAADGRTSNRGGIFVSIRHMIGGAAAAMRDNAGSAAKGARSSVGQVGTIASQAADAVARGASDVGHTAGSVTGRAADAISDAATSSLDAAGEYAGRAKDTVLSAAASAEQAGYDLVRNLNRLTREQPLMVAAAGLAIGAAIAALLPKTNMEDSLMGETSDAVKRSVSDVAAEGVGAAVDALGNVADKVIRTAEDAGLSPSRAAGGVETLADKVANVASAGLGAAKEEADRLLKPRSA